MNCRAKTVSSLRRRPISDRGIVQPGGSRPVYRPRDHAFATGAAALFEFSKPARVSPVEKHQLRKGRAQEGRGPDERSIVGKIDQYGEIRVDGISGQDGFQLL